MGHDDSRHARSAQCIVDGRVPRAAVSPSTGAHPHRTRSGSIPHDAVTTDRGPQRHPSFSLVRNQQRPRLSRLRPFAADRPTNAGAQCAVSHLFPACSPTPRAKPIAALPPRPPLPVSRRRQIPIARHRRRTTSRRDFVPWRFSDAGRMSAWRVCARRRPKTCTKPTLARPVVHMVAAPWIFLPYREAPACYSSHIERWASSWREME